MELDLGKETTFNHILVRHDAAARTTEVPNITKAFTVSVRNQATEQRNEVYAVMDNSLPITDVVLPRR